jgi:hypothetical protein
VDVGPVSADADIIFYFLFLFLSVWTLVVSAWIYECIRVDIGLVRTNAEKNFFIFIFSPDRANAGRVRADVLMHLRFSLGAKNANGGLM